MSFAARRLPITDMAVLPFLMQLAFASFYLSGAHACMKRKDVALVYELPNSGADKYVVLSDSIKQLERAMTLADHDCLRLAVIVAGKQADVLIHLDCAYGNATCYKTAMKKIDTWAKTAELDSYDRGSLVKAIDKGTQILFSDQARVGVEKTTILVLSNSPENDEIPTEDAVKDLHDLGVELFVVGVGEGLKDNLDFIALKQQNIFKANEGASTVPAMGFLGQIVAGTLIVPAGIESVNEDQNPLLGREPANLVYAQIQADSKEACEVVMDLGIAIDSSGSIERYYEKEKLFVQRMGAKLNVPKGSSKVGVIVFSSGSFVKMLMPFSREYETLEEFSNEAGRLPFYKYQTRIDKALRVANDELFSEKNGMRPNVRKVLIIITDGKQDPPSTKLDGLEKVYPPEEAAKPLHDRNITIFAIGIGSKVDRDQLERITRSPEKVFTLKRFNDLVGDNFFKNISSRACQPAKIVTSPAPTVTFTLKSSKRPSTTRGAPITTKRSTTKKMAASTTAASRTTAEKKSDCSCDKKCSDCKSEQKSEVFINVFNGANNNNVVLQDSKVTQNGSGSLQSINPKLLAGTNLRNKSSTEIMDLIKELLPQHARVSQAVQEILRRSIQQNTKGTK